jgi:hypothetical protein
VIEDFEGEAPRGLVDAGQGPAHRIAAGWQEEPLFGGRRQQRVEIVFPEGDAPERDELYDLEQDPQETVNLLQGGESTTARVLIEHWLQSEPTEPELMEMSAEQLEALRALGYTAK